MMTLKPTGLLTGTFRSAASNRISEPLNIRHVYGLIKLKKDAYAVTLKEQFNNSTKAWNNMTLELAYWLLTVLAGVSAGCG